MSAVPLESGFELSSAQLALGVALYAWVGYYACLYLPYRMLYDEYQSYERRVAQVCMLLLYQIDKRERELLRPSVLRRCYVECGGGGAGNDPTRGSADMIRFTVSLRIPLGYRLDGS